MFVCYNINMKITNEPNKLYPPEVAEKVAAELNASGDGWKYVVNHDPKGTGYSFIEVYDEDGIFVSKF
jgi:hypothetical protein